MTHTAQFLGIAKEKARFVHEVGLESCTPSAPPH